MSKLVDVKFSNNEMFVLSSREYPCIHVFTLSGEKSRSLLGTRGYETLVIGTFFFCLDGKNNILISDLTANIIKVLSPEEDILYTIGQSRHGAGIFYVLFDIEYTNKTRLSF
ncbi:hypothetical protein LOD99_9590 [Oopsacas minuta]|uniref:Uncharacterized protein n=1 Tax=Oopsacas minuta TaxID=111878 RepID=A0AAV7KN01_9METZ|nr:hypothetical protein LOD99_9590 [Oopsacas minuta]